MSEPQTDRIAEGAIGGARLNGIRRIALAVLPLALFAALGVFLYAGLSLNPREIPSVLIDKPVPDFDLPPIEGRPGGLARDDLVGEVSLLNVFASWCVACRVEHPLLMRLKREGIVPVHGLNYKDAPADALDWLGRHGDPYDLIGADRKGRVAIEFGVYGVPETFLIGADGRILCKHIGPIQGRDFETKLLPAIEAARRGERAAC